MSLARISQTLSRHSSLSYICSSRSSRLHPVSVQSYCRYVQAARSTLALPREGVHWRTSFISPSLLLQQCPVYLVRLVFFSHKLNLGNHGKQHGGWEVKWMIIDALWALRKGPFFSATSLQSIIVTASSEEEIVKSSWRQNVGRWVRKKDEKKNRLPREID